MPSLSWYQVPDDIKQLLESAAATWQNPEQSEQYMQQALADPEVPIAVLVSAYRYFFYQNKNGMALTVAERVLERVRLLENLPQDWDHLAPVLASRKEEELIRLYLNAYSASGLVRARLGDTEQAREIATRVKAIDDRNEFGAATVFNILTQPPDDDD